MGQVILKKDGNTAILSIDRPEAMNALNRDLVNDMDMLVEKLKTDDDIRCLILHSEKNFAAGADIKAMARCDEEAAKAFVFSGTYNKIADLEIPVIAAIEGYALGGGMELAMTADIRIAGEGAKMGFPEVTLGIIPGAGGTIRVPRVVGESCAKELIFTGKIIDARKAESIGLVNRVTPDDEVLQEALKLAGRITRNAPIAVKAAKRVIRAGLDEPEQNKGIDTEAAEWARLFTTEDQKEGMNAFFEKRKPVFKNR